ncbi:hypothetical protein QAD02_020201 [Eretmocerus hayati]|uniref:Uncharacterized protein n=1 Tax=Eretmocerus hayati TaxID=131215 RepID=A0ACC2PP86_9HYME|nr:hypothetical protein QAD02_020201 [Eretmocerus hayati]
MFHESCFRAELLYPHLRLEQQQVQCLFSAIVLCVLCPAGPKARPPAFSACGPTSSRTSSQSGAAEQIRSSEPRWGCDGAGGVFSTRVHPSTETRPRTGPPSNFSVMKFAPAAS